MRIQGLSVSPALSISPVKPMHSLSPNGLQPTNLQTIVTLSETAIAKNELLQRFQPPSNSSDNQAALLVFLSEKYSAIRSELISQGGDNQQQSLTMLSDVYDEITAGAADQLSNQFDMFFNSSRSLLSSNGMTADANMFDKDAFRNHFINLAKAAKQIAVEHPGEVASRLELNEPSGRLETMNYRDIVSMVDAIQNLSKIKQPPAGGSDPAKLGDQLAEWHKASIQVLANAGLSENIRKAAESSLEKGVKAKIKNSAFKQAIDQFNAKMEELRKQIARYSVLIAALKGKFELLKGLEPNDPRIQSLLHREQELMKNQADYRNELKENKTKLNELKENPDSVIDTEGYLQIDKSYQKEMDTK